MSGGQKRYIIGIDTGGTFTDSVVLDIESGETLIAKAPTTPHDFSIGVMNAIQESAKLMSLQRKVVAVCAFKEHVQ